VIIIYFIAINFKIPISNIIYKPSIIFLFLFALFGYQAGFMAPCGFILLLVFFFFLSCIFIYLLHGCIKITRFEAGFRSHD